MAVRLDPRKAHKAHIVGDILVILSWVNDERAMILMPARRAHGSPWFVLCESAAYQYDDPRYLARQAAKAAEVLGMDETTSAAYRIADVILNYLPDLIRMPATPDTECMDAAIGSMMLKADGQTVAQQDIRLDKAVPEYA